jgi:hypothetical protein
MALYKLRSKEYFEKIKEGSDSAIAYACSGHYPTESCWGTSETTIASTCIEAWFDPCALTKPDEQSDGYREDCQSDMCDG